MLKAWLIANIPAFFFSPFWISHLFSIMKPSLIFKVLSVWLNLAIHCILQVCWICKNIFFIKTNSSKILMCFNQYAKMIHKNKPWAFWSNFAKYISVKISSINSGRERGYLWKKIYNPQVCADYVKLVSSVIDSPLAQLAPPPWRRRCSTYWTLNPASRCLVAMRGFSPWLTLTPNKCWVSSNPRWSLTQVCILIGLYC